MENDLKAEVIAWVKEILTDRGFVEVDVEFPEYDASGGYGSEMVVVNAMGERHGKPREVLSLIVKRSMDGILTQDNLNMKVFYENEINLYGKIAPCLREFAIQRGSKPFESLPSCYGTINRENRFVIVMENMKTKDYKLNDIKRPMDIDHVKLVLEAYAQWHALCLALRDQEPNVFEQFSESNSGKNSFKAKAFEYMVATIEKELTFLQDMYKARGLTLVGDKLEFLKTNFGKMMTDCMSNKDEDYVVIRHGDCWNNNFLFHYEQGETKPNKVSIIDWQVAVACSPMVDIVHFLFYCCARKELDLLDEFLKFYYDSLSKVMKELGSSPEKCFPWDICIESFNKYAPIGISALPMIGKLRSKVEVAETYNIANVERDGNYNSIFNGKLLDPEEYFKDINDVLEFCTERGFI